MNKTLIDQIPYSFTNRIVPVKDKRPVGGNGWNKKTYKVEDLPNYDYNALGVLTGVLPDETGGILALDFDDCAHLVPEDIGGMEIRSPRPNSCKLIFHIPEGEVFDLLQLRLKNKGRTPKEVDGGKVEIFWGKNQAQVVFAGKHPQGEYTHEQGEAGNFNPDILLTFLKEYTTSPKRTEVIHSIEAEHTDPSWDLMLAKKILSDPRMHSERLASYDEWLKVLMALKWAGDRDDLENEYLELAHQWSEKVPNYDGAEVVDKAWEGIKNQHDDPITFGSLITTAKELGIFIPRKRFPDLEPTTKEGKLLSELISSSSPEDWGTAFAEYYSGQLFVNQTDLKEISFYDTKKKYFRKVNRDYLIKEVKPFLNNAHKANKENKDWKLTNEKRKQAVDNLILDLSCDTDDVVFNPDKHLLPLKTNVLNTTTLAEIEHSPKIFNDYVLPYDYDPSATCPIMDRILKDAFGGNFYQELVLIFKCFCKVGLHGVSGLQRFLEIVGEPGSSKGVLGRFFHTLMGYNNVYATSLDNLETHRFGAYNYAQKRAILINEISKEKRYLKTFYNITGGDPLKAEAKNVQEEKTLYFGGNVLITANRHLQSKDDCSALERRRISIVTERVVPKNEIDPFLIVFDRNKVSGRLIHELPGFLNQLLEIDLDFAVDYLVYKDRLPSQKSYRKRIMAGMSTIAEWALTSIVQGDTDTDKIWLSSRNSKDYALFNYYKRWCYENNHSVRHSVQSFKRELDKALQMLDIQYSIIKPKNKVTYVGLEVLG